MPGQRRQLGRSYGTRCVRARTAAVEKPPWMGVTYVDRTGAARPGPHIVPGY